MDNTVNNDENDHSSGPEMGPKSQRHGSSIKRLKFGRGCLANWTQQQQQQQQQQPRPPPPPPPPPPLLPPMPLPPAPILNPYLLAQQTAKKRAEQARQNEREEEQRKRVEEAKIRVDLLGTKICKKCEKGTSYKKAHNLTCPNSQHHTANCKEALALLPKDEREKLFRRINKRRTISDKTKSGPMDAFVVTALPAAEANVAIIDKAEAAKKRT